MKMQCMNKLSSLAAFGEKKNDKDMDRSDPNFNPTRSKKIHSVSTMKTYKSVAANFCDFMKQHYPSVKQIEQIETAHVRDYIESRHEQGYSNYSLSKELSCLNKLCHNENRDFWRLSEFGNCYARRSEDIVNNRGIKCEYHTDHYERNQSAILMCSAFGMRRSSTETATMDQLVRNDRNEIVGIYLIEKGGRERYAPCLESYKEQINQYFSERISQHGSSYSICEKADSNTNLHAYRSLYAVSLYKELTAARGCYDWYDGMRSLFVNEKALEKACSHPRYNTEYVRGYHTETLGLVSQALG